MTSVQYPSSDADIRGGMTPAVRWIIAVNVAVYFLQLTLFGAETMAGWFALEPVAFPGHWWTMLTYMFVHAGAVHLATNMVMLWMFGPRVERAFGTRSFTYFYIWCGLGGAVFHLLFVPNGGVVGASGAVVGVVLAYALRWPDDEVYIFGVVPMQARWLALWTIAVNVGMALADMTGYASGTTAWMAHVGGVAFAWLYLHAPTGTSLERIRRHVAMAPDDSAPKPIPKVRRSARYEQETRRTEREEKGGESFLDRRGDDPPRQMADEVVARSNALVTHRAAPVEAPRANDRIEGVDALLDKISRAGLQSLTPQERRLLEDMSRQLRNS